jgi:uncharacterized protein
VIRGDLLVIPIEDTFIYVEPVYLEAKQEESETPSGTQTQPRVFGRSQTKQTTLSSGVDKSRAASLPELKRVIVAFGNRLVMEKDLDTAILAVLGEQVLPEELASPGTAESLDIYRLGPQALEHYTKAKEYMSQGDWAAYGRELDQLEDILKQIARIKEEKKE